MSSRTSRAKHDRPRIALTDYLLQAMLLLAAVAAIALLTYHGLPADLEYEVGAEPCNVLACRSLQWQTRSNSMGRLDCNREEE
jgi:hypothetical protein